MRWLCFLVGDKWSQIRSPLLKQAKNGHTSFPTLLYIYYQPSQPVINTYSLIKKKIPPSSNRPSPIPLCTIFTIQLTLCNSEQKNGLLINFFYVFHLILMKLGEVVVTHVFYNFTKFHQNRMKNKKVFLIAHFSVQNFKVSVES